MSAKTPNQFDYHGTKPSWRKWKKRLKKQTSKTARRIGKKRLDDAPRRITGGWTS